MNIADILIDFRDTQDTTRLHIDTAADHVEELNVIAIEVLSWLKLEHKRYLWRMEGKRAGSKPLRINMGFPWGAYLSELMEGNNVLSEVFTLSEDGLSFRDDIGEECRAKIRQTAYEKYAPQKID